MNSFTAQPAPTQYGGAPAPVPPSYPGAPVPAPPSQNEAAAPTPYGGAPGSNPFNAAPAPSPFTAAPATASFTAASTNNSYTAASEARPFTATSETTAFTGAAETPPFTAAAETPPFTAAAETPPFTAAPAPAVNDSKPTAPTPTEETVPAPSEPTEPKPPPSLSMKSESESSGLGLDANAAFAKFATMDLIAKPNTPKDDKDRENPFEDVVTKAPAPTLAGMKMMGGQTEKKEVMKPDPDSMSQPGALVLSGNQTGNWNAYASLGSQAPGYTPQNSMVTPGYGQVGDQMGSMGMAQPVQSQGNVQPQQYYGMSSNQGGTSNYPYAMNGQNQQPQPQQQPQYQQ